MLNNHVFLFVQQIIKKQILKNKLMDQLGVNFAYKECVVHSLLEHDNVVKLHEYTENDGEFVLFMEYCNDAEYFDNKIVEVSHFFGPEPIWKWKNFKIKRQADITILQFAHKKLLAPV